MEMIEGIIKGIETMLEMEDSEEDRGWFCGINEENYLVRCEGGQRGVCNLNYECGGESGCVTHDPPQLQRITPCVQTAPIRI